MSDSKDYIRHYLNAGIELHKVTEKYKQKITALEKQCEEMKTLLLELGAETHKNKNLYKWYCENAEKYPGGK